MVGERGGGFESFEDAAEAMEQHKPNWSALIRAGIEAALAETNGFHSDDLLHLGVPAAHKNCIGAQVQAVKRAGLMEETGVWRSGTGPARHGGRSPVYRITELGRQKLRPEVAAAKREPSPRQPAAAISGAGSDDRTGGGSLSSPATAPPTLFEPEPVRTGLSHYESEAA